MILRRTLLILLASFSLWGCGKTATSPELHLEMYAVARAPDGVTGNSAPRWEEFKLAQVDFIKTDGTKANLFTTSTTPDSLRIIERPQIVYQQDLADFEDQDFQGVQVTFDPTVTGTDRSGNERTVALKVPTIQFPKQFSFSSKDTTVTFLIKVLWNNTASDEAIEGPGLELTDRD